MPAWATVLLTLGSTAIGATAALTASWLQLRSARRDRERAEASARRARGAAVLGPTRVLDDLEPQAIGASGGRSEQTFRNIGRRWWRARDALLVFGAVDPSRRRRGSGEHARRRSRRHWTSVVALNRDVSSADALRSAIGKHAGAREAADRLGQLLRHAG